MAASAGHVGGVRDAEANVQEEVDENKQKGVGPSDEAVDGQNEHEHIVDDNGAIDEKTRLENEAMTSWRAQLWRNLTNTFCQACPR